MNTLQSAKDMKQLSSEKYEAFQKESVDSPAFKRLVETIEQAALNGHSRTIFKFQEEEELSMVGVFLNLLRNAGYKVEVMLGNKLSIKWQ